MRKWIPLMGVLLLLLVGCAEPAPTPAPQVSATAVSAPEQAATETLTVVPAETAVATTVATVVATDSPVPNPTPTIMMPTPLPASYELTIDQPSSQSTVIVGQQTTFSGKLHPAPVDSVDIRLQIGERVVFTGFATVDADTGEWSLTTAVSPNIVGPATLTVAQTELEVLVSQPVQLAPDTRQAEPFITLARPEEDVIVATGHTLFFEGRVGNAIDDKVHIGVLAEDCATFVATISFDLESGFWSGYVILPQQVSGDACAVAYTGTYGEGNWREARVPLVLADPLAEPFTKIAVGNPGELDFSAGEEIMLYGVSVPGGGEVQVQLMAADGTEMLLDATAVADVFGYWEITAVLPDGYSGPATLVASAGEGDTLAEIRQAVTITP